MDTQSSKVDANKQLSIREAARRLLRFKTSKIILPENYSEEAEGLILELLDIQPGNIIDPEIVLSNELETIELFDSENKIVQLGGSEPEDYICWVPGDIRVLWNDFCKYAIALSDAGYPGCLNCGGRDAGEEWDEMKRRSQMKII